MSSVTYYNISPSCDCMLLSYLPSYWIDLKTKLCSCNSLHWFMPMAIMSKLGQSSSLTNLFWVFILILWFNLSGKPVWKVKKENTQKCLTYQLFWDFMCVWCWYIFRWEKNCAYRCKTEIYDLFQFYLSLYFISSLSNPQSLFLWTFRYLLQWLINLIITDTHEEN